MIDPIPGLKGRCFVEQNDPDENFVKPNAGKCAGKRGKKQVQINDSLDKDKEKVGEGSSHKDLGKGLAEGSSYKGKGKLGKDRSEPSKVSQTTKERWRKKKLEEEKNLKNAVDCPFRLWASWMSTEKSFQIKTLYPDHKCCRNYNLGSLVTYRWIAEHYAREIIDNPWVSYNYMQNSIREANNQMFPIAWAVVGVENKNNWCWFLSLLSDDLNLNDRAGLTVISDGYKVVYASGFQEVEVRRQDESFGVNIHLKKCACNMWELTGLPCMHDVAGYIHLKKDLELGVIEWFSKNKWFESYQYSIKPGTPGSKLWKKSDLPKPLPPSERKLPG
nr:zinc finger, PMZ-type [Tanacetum cinerariifolium]